MQVKCLKNHVYISWINCDEIPQIMIMIFEKIQKQRSLALSALLARASRKLGVKFIENDLQQYQNLMFKGESRKIVDKKTLNKHFDLFGWYVFNDLCYYKLMSNDKKIDWVMKVRFTAAVKKGILIINEWYIYGNRLNSNNI